MKRYEKAEDIKVGVIGYGGAFNMGKSHLNQLRAVGMVPFAVAELDKDRLAVAEEDFPGIETYDSVDAMLDHSEVDLIVIITPHNTHAPLAIQCLNAGKHVVCEKPLALTMEECDAMISAAEANDVMLSTYHNRHWDGWILTAVEKIVKEKVIGEVFKIEAHMGQRQQPGDWWRTSRSISGGILYDWGVHLLEYSLQILDGKIREISGFSRDGYWTTRWGDDTTEDEARAIVRFDDGKWLTLTLTSLDGNMPRGMLEITGTDGTYIMDWQNYTIIKQNGKERIETRGEHRPSETEKYYQNIADHLVKGTALIITPEWSRRPIQIIDLAVQSAREGRALPARYD